jgi:NAD+ synthase
VIRPVPLPDPETVTRVLVGFLEDEVRKAGFERAVVAVSGGLDSAVTLALAARALGPGKVTAVLLPHEVSSPESTRDGQAVAEAAGCGHEIFEITPMLEGYTRGAGVEDRLRLGNLMARLRMAVLYDRAAHHRALVVGTSNKSELLLGYSTRWGDGASDLNPIGDLYKTQLYPVAAHLGIPRAVLEKAPSADLWQGQTDEAEMGFSYAEVDGLLHYLVDEHGTPEGAVREAGFEKAFVERVVSIVKRSQFKRRMPLIAKVSTRTVGVDFRYPRDWDL